MPLSVNRLKSFYASAECINRHLDPFITDSVVADASYAEKAEPVKPFKSYLDKEGDAR